MNNLMLDIAQKAAEEALKITPFNGAAFGALVLVLGFFAYTFYKDGKKKDEQLHEMAVKAAAVIAIVEEKLIDPADFKSVAQDVRDLKEMVRDLNR